MDAVKKSKAYAARGRLFWLEAALWLVGISLLGYYSVVRASGEIQSQQGMDQFQEARELAAAQPDFSLWSPARVQHYHDSLASGGDGPLGVLHIPGLDLSVPMFDGDSEHNLNRGVARIPGTATINGAGNLGIAGHRDGYFRVLKDIHMGDTIELESLTGVRRYKVSELMVVDPSYVKVLEPTEENTITLVTCFPFYHVGNAPRRFIVKATLDTSTVDT